MVSRETQLVRYFELLAHWNQAINLTSRNEFGSAWFARQIETSLALQRHFPSDTQRFTDLGSGQGLPAIPLAIATGLEVDLVEADRRKAAFLNTVLAKLQLPGKVWVTRIEAAHLPRAPCVTAQALATLSKLISLALPLVQPGGCCLFLKGANVTTEMRGLPQTRDFLVEVIRLAPLASSLVKVTRIT